MKLYPHQERAVLMLRESLFTRGHKRTLAVMPTGAGKTVLAAHISQTLAGRGARMAFVVHRQELVEQAESTMRSVGISTARVTAGRHARLGAAPMTICTVQTLASRLERQNRSGRRPNEELNYVWWDEAHHIAARTWERVSQIMRGWWPNLIEIGLTATPRRADGKGLDVIFTDMIIPTDIRSLIQSRHLSDWRLISTKTNMSALRKEMKLKRDRSDFDGKRQGEVVARKIDLIAGETVELYRKYVQGEQAIFFGVDTVHSELTARAFNAAGISAAHVDGNTDPFRRRRMISDFREGRTLVLCNFSIVNEGFDVPEASAVIIARHTRSIVFWLQAIGRALRYREGKIATIIDQAANWQEPELGMPDDEREWSLSSASGDAAASDEERKKDPTLRACPGCHTLTRLTLCPSCGTALASYTDVRQHDSDFGVVADSGAVQSIAATIAGHEPRRRRSRIPRTILQSQLSEIYARHGKSRDDAELMNELRALADKYGYKHSWADLKFQYVKNRR